MRKRIVTSRINKRAGWRSGRVGGWGDRKCEALV